MENMLHTVYALFYRALRMFSFKTKHAQNSEQTESRKFVCFKMKGNQQHKSEAWCSHFHENIRPTTYAQ